MTTWHCASLPQDPGHGSLHLLFMQARFDGQSGFIIHSGRQFGGVPMYDDKHEHDGLLPEDIHWEFGPHGEGTHGFLGGSYWGGSTGSKTN